MLLPSPLLLLDRWPHPDPRHQRPCSAPSSARWPPHSRPDASRSPDARSFCGWPLARATPNLHRPAPPTGWRSRGPPSRCRRAPSPTSSSPSEQHCPELPHETSRLVCPVSEPGANQLRPHPQILQHLLLLLCCQPHHRRRHQHGPRGRCSSTHRSCPHMLAHLHAKTVLQASVAPVESADLLEVLNTPRTKRVRGVPMAAPVSRAKNPL
mmetsp:Transcript_139124/g.443983  ORF Transcript_139124/g.443983 Transcript_139124/m.443983 type:complete len:210 (+) Transcript_139124:810-1439(+)